MMICLVGIFDFFYLDRHLKKLKHTSKSSIYLHYSGKYKVQIFVPFQACAKQQIDFRKRKKSKKKKAV